MLGFDILIDKYYRPWLIEVNQSPSFATDSPLDYRVKKAVITDTFKMLNVSWAKREKIIKEAEEAMRNRILTGKNSKIDKETRKIAADKALAQRFKYEETRMGDWKMIYPCEDAARNTVYDGFIKKANDLWDGFTTGKKGLNKQMHQESKSVRKPPQKIQRKPPHTKQSAKSQLPIQTKIVVALSEKESKPVEPISSPRNPMSSDKPLP